MIIWGTKAKREGRGFVLKACRFCQADRIHFVAQSKSKFTLYFVPTLTLSTKALLICTQCERQEEINGAQGKSYLDSALPREEMLALLRGRQPHDGNGRPESERNSQTQSPVHCLAVGMLVVSTQVSLVDGVIDDGEATALGQGFATISSATKSDQVKQAARLVESDLGGLLDWIQSPATGPLALMLADAGQVLRQSSRADQSRYIGQVAWLCETVAAASGGVIEAEVEQMDSGLAMMGLSPTEVAEALVFCERNGG